MTTTLGNPLAIICKLYRFDEERYNAFRQTCRGGEDIVNEKEIISGQLARARNFKILVDGPFDSDDLRQIIILLTEKMADMSEEDSGDDLDNLIANEDD